MSTQPNQPHEASDERFKRIRRRSRRSALQYLYQADVQDDWGDLEPNLLRFRSQLALLDKDPVDSDEVRAWEFAERIIRGVCEQREALDQIVGACATNWTVNRMSVIDRNLLRMATYQLRFCDDVPAVAAVNEAIELAKEFGHRDSARFVNGVLDRILRDGADSGKPEDSEEVGG